MRLKRHVNMLEGSIIKNMIIFCIPIIITNYIQILYSAADIMVVGKFGSDAALSGVTACNSLINLIVNFFLGLSVGINVVVSNRIGANDRTAVQNGVNTTVFLALFGGILAGAIGYFASDSMLVLMNTPEETLPQASIYVKLYFLGVPGILMTNFGSSVLRSAGDTQRPLYFMIVSGLSNVLLNLLLVIVFHLDAAGVAVATTVSNYLSAALIFIAMTKIDGVCRLNVKQIKFHLKTALDIFRIGIPSGINSCMYAISNTIIQSSVNSFGQFAVSGNGIATNLDNILSLSFTSVYHAAMTFTGQNHGAKNHKRIRPIFYSALVIDIFIWLILGSLVLIFKEPLLYLFSNNPKVVELAMIKVTILASFFILGGWMDTSTGCLRGLGCSTIPMFVSFIGVCALRVFWVYTVFASNPTLETLYFSFPVSWLVTFAANTVIYFMVSKKVIDDLKKETV